MELMIDSKKIKKHELILILVYTTQPCSCCFYCLLLDYISPDMQHFIKIFRGPRSHSETSVPAFELSRCKRQRLRCQVLKLSRRSWRNWTTRALDRLERLGEKIYDKRSLNGTSWVKTKGWVKKKGSKTENSYCGNVQCEELCTD